MESGDFDVIGFLDDTYPSVSSVWDVPVLGRIADFRDNARGVEQVFVAIGNNQARADIVCKLTTAGLELATVIHPRAVVSRRATIGVGSAVMAGAIVGTEACLGVGVIVNCAAVVDHHCRVGDFGHLGVGAVMAGGSILGHGSWMQAGAALGYGVAIGQGVTLAPGHAVATC